MKVVPPPQTQQPQDRGAEPPAPCFALLAADIVAGCTATPSSRQVSLPVAEAAAARETQPEAQREHARILASYGGVYENARVQDLDRENRRAPGGRLRTPGPQIPRHHPQFAGDQCLRAAERASLYLARADRAGQRQGRTRLGAGARDGPRDRAPRRHPRGAGAPDRHHRHFGQRRAERSGNRRVGARQIETDVGELLARAGIRGRRHRRRHFGARRLRSVRRLALPHRHAAQRRPEDAGRRRRSARHRIFCPPIRRRPSG